MSERLGEGERLGAKLMQEQNICGACDCGA